MASNMPARRQERAVLYILVCLALALRLYRLDEQSAWFDDFNALMLDPAASFADYMAHVRDVNPDHVPLYFMLVFGWTKLAGGGMLGLRLLSVGLYCAALPMIYHTGKRLFGPWAACCGGLFYALCPLGVYLAQATRYNALLSLLAIVSIALTLRPQVWRSLPWLVLHAAVNTAMIFTHLTSTLLVAVEGVYLLAAAGYFETGRILPARGNLLRLFLWGGLHLPAVGECVLWLSRVQGAGVTWYTMPTWKAWLVDLLGDGMVHGSAEFRFTALVEGPLQQAATRWPNVLSGYLLLVFMGAALVCGGITLVRALRTRDKIAAPTFFALLLAVGPLLALTLVSLVWHPVALPRYTTFSSLGLFWLAAAMLQKVRPAVLRYVLLGGVVLAYAVQLGVVLGNPTRTDWVGAAKELDQRAATDDPVYALRIMPGWTEDAPLPGEILRYHLGHRDLRIFSAHSLAGMLDQAVANLAAADAPQHAWLLLEDFSGFPQRTALEQHLRTRGIVARPWKSTALYLYELVGKPVPDGGKQDPLLGPSDAALHSAFAPSPEHVDALRWAVAQVSVDKDPYARLVAGVNAMELDPAAGLAIADTALAAAPGNAPAHLLRAIALATQRRTPEAQAEFAQVDAALRAFALQQWPGVDALIAGDIATAHDTAARVSALGPSKLPPFFHYLLGLAPPPRGARLSPLLPAQ